MHGLCHDKKSERAGCIASAQILAKELPAGHGLRSANLILSAVKTKSNNALPFGGKSNKPFNTESTSTFQLVVASVFWLSNVTSAHARRPSSHKSSCASGLHCQLIVESVFEQAQSQDIAPASICKQFFNFINASHSEGEHSIKPNDLINRDNLDYFYDYIGLVGPIELVELISCVDHTNDFVGSSQMIVAIASVNTKNIEVPFAAFD
jgi:hypothetical protein